MPPCDLSSAPARAVIALVATLAVAAGASPAWADGPTRPLQRIAPAQPGLGAALPTDPRRGAPKPRVPQADQWIVELDAPPLARYTGGVAGLDATAPSATGRKLDRSTPTRAPTWAS